MYLSMRKKKMAGKEDKLVSEVFAKFGWFAAAYSNYSQLIRPRKRHGCKHFPSEADSLRSYSSF
jgi:hypothetical protein